uniref:BHLH domain-containing protein n=1 Tax=Sander lucioperca TaxID=283035 RepID=A0A8C9Z793_SANLU
EEAVSTRNSCSLRCPLRGFSRGFPRNKSLSPGEYVPAVPALLPRDMELCYRLLRRLVPGLPRGRAASRVEILQHVIDYIRDLQTELDASWPTGDRGTNLHTCQVGNIRGTSSGGFGDGDLLISPHRTQELLLYRWLCCFRN